MFIELNSVGGGVFFLNVKSIVLFYRTKMEGEDVVKLIMSDGSEVYTTDTYEHLVSLLT